MIFKLATLVLILLITFFQSITGMFSASIMFVLTIASACMAFGLYESIFNSLLGQYLPAYGHAVALIGVFLITLGVSRVLADTLFKTNLEFPALIDRIGAGVFGFCSAMMMVGMLTISIQLLPFGRDILGFQRLVKVNDAGDPLDESATTDPNQVRFELRSLWLSPDGFAVKVVSMMSGASFSGEYSMIDVHPDFLTELQQVRYGPQKGSRQIIPPDAVRVEAVWPLNDDLLQDGDVALRSPDDHWLCIRTRISLQDETKDSDKLFRLIPMQARLVGWPRGRGNGPTKQYSPIGVALTVLENSPDGEHRRMAPDQPIMLVGSQYSLIDLIYEVPREFVPWFLGFKRGARAEISQHLFAAGQPKPLVVEAIIEPEDSGGEGQADGATGDDDDEGSNDRVSGRHVRGGQSRFDRKLPVPLEPSWMVGTDKDVSGSQLRSGHVVTDWPIFEAELSVAVTDFFVPPNMQLYQLSVTRDEAQSIFGRALNFARNTLGQFIVRDEEGDSYFRIGEIRIANVGGTRKAEIQYWPQAEIPERCIKEARTVSDALLKGTDYTLIYLYLIPDGRKPVEFDTGNRIRKIK